MTPNRPCLTLRLGFAGRKDLDASAEQVSMRSGPGQRLLRSLGIAALFLATWSVAQTITFTEASRQVQLAVYQANATQEAIKSQMNAELRKRTEGVGVLEAQLHALKQTSAGKAKAQAAQIEKLANALAAAQAEVVKMLETDRSYREQIRIFRNEVSDIAKDPERLAALTIYNEGREFEALTILDRIRGAKFKAKRRAAEIAVNIEEAAIERQDARLAYNRVGRPGISVRSVIERYKRVVALDPTEWDWGSLARLYQQSGELAKAAEAANQMLDFTEAVDSDSALTKFAVAAALNNVGEIKAAQGDAESALAAFERSLAIVGALAQAECDSGEAKRAVSYTLNNVGHLKAVRGDVAGALAVYERSLEIREALAVADPGSARAKRDVADSHNHIGEIKALQSDAAGALAAYQHSLDIAEKLSGDDPDSAEATRDVSICLENVGRIKAAQGDAAGALAAYERSLGIREALVQADRSSAMAKRDVASILNGVSQIKAAQGDTDGALLASQRSLDISEALAQIDLSSAEAKRGVSISLGNLGRIKAAQGDVAGALAAYQRSLEIAEGLIQRDTSARAKRDVSVSLHDIGQIKTTQGDTAGALAAFQRMLDITEALAQADPDNAKAQRDLIASHGNLWQVATERSVARRHAGEIDRIFTTLEARGALISPADRTGWKQIQQWLKDHP